MSAMFLDLQTIDGRPERGQIPKVRARCGLCWEAEPIRDLANPDDIAALTADETNHICQEPS